MNEIEARQIIGRCCMAGYKSCLRVAKTEEEEMDNVSVCACATFSCVSVLVFWLLELFCLLDPFFIAFTVCLDWHLGILGTLYLYRKVLRVSGIGIVDGR